MKASKNHHLKYLVTNTTDELWGLHATTIGHQFIVANEGYPPKQHPSSYWFNVKTGRILHEYQLLYIVSGEGIFASANCKPTKITAGYIVFLFPDEWHTYYPLKQSGWAEYWLGFKGKMADDLLQNSFFSPKKPLLNIGFNEQLVALFKQGIDIAEYQKTAYQQVLAGIISLLLGQIFYADKNNAFRDKAIISQIDKARLMLRENLDNTITPEKIAAMLNISYSWFRRIFKQYTGFSPAQYQMEIKLQKAKELLTSTSLQIKEIAFELNFDSVSYFVTFFKMKTNTSPTDYRKKVQGRVDN
jgi:AraC-like DNA-binding protein